jgi:hypothetical protein
MKHLKLFNSFVNEELENENLNEDWGSSDQAIMNKAIHKDMGNPSKFPSPFDDKLRSAAADAVDFWFDEWPEYKRDREGLIDNAIRAYYRSYFPKEFAGFTKMFSESVGVISEGVVSIKGGRILAHKVLNKLVDMDIIPVKKKSEEAVEAVASVLATTSMAESVFEGFEVIYTNQNVRGSKKFSDRSKAMSFAKELIAQGANEVDVFNAGGNFNSSADTGAVIAWYGNGTYMDNMSKKDPKLAAKKIDESELNEGMVQIAGKNKPSGAKVLATIIVDDLMKKDYLKPGADKVKSYLVDDIQDVIMNNTF